MIPYSKIAITSAAALLTFATPAQAWEYSTIPDKMGRGDARFAVSESSNEVDLKFPYNGPQHARLTVLDRGGKRTDVVFVLPKGQLLCRTDACDFLVQFDDQPPQKWWGTPPNDGSSNVIFLEMEPIFIAKATRAKTVMIEVTIHQNGNKVFEFPVGPLEGKWLGGSEQYGKKAK